MCGSTPTTPPQPPPPPPPIAPVDPEDNVLVSGGSSKNRQRAIAGGRNRQSILTGARGVLGDANTGKTLLGG